MNLKDKILVIDNGTQYGQLYAKRLRDLGIEVDTIDAGVYLEGGELIRPRVLLEEVEEYKGIVIAGGRSSVTISEEERVDIDRRIYSEFEGPILGTCFGHQDMADRLGGKVEKGIKQCGPVYTKVDLNNPFFVNLKEEVQRVNATHNDGVSTLPPGFRIIAGSENEIDGELMIDAMFRIAEEGKNNYRIGTQFHPETFLTENGTTMLLNFLGMCGVRPKNVGTAECTMPTQGGPNIDTIVEEQYSKIQEVVGDMPVFLPISGGIDSTTATKMLLNAGISGDRIKAFHIDTGYNRYGESEEVVKQYLGMEWDFVELIEAKEFFANYSLKEDELREDLQDKGFGGITLKEAVFSEHKRYLFQRAYADIIDQVQQKFGINETNSILVQGTNQADKVESGKGGKRYSASAHIKSHHNVGNFVDKFRAHGNLLEPMDRFFKSDIYALGEKFGLPEFFSTRKPFPGPGLLIRIGNHDMVKAGRYNPEDVERLSKLANQYSEKRGISTYVTNLEAVGTCGDDRAEGVMAVLQFKEDHEKDLEIGIDELMYTAGQMPHYTTLGNKNCITRLIMPLFEFEAGGGQTKLENGGETVEYLQIFDDEMNKIVDELGIKMTQVVNYVISDDLGFEGKYTFVFRPWIAPDLMSGMPLIPEIEKREELFARLRGLKDKYDFIGNICIDLTYKPIGGTEIN